MFSLQNATPVVPLSVEDGIGDGFEVAQQAVPDTKSSRLNFLCLYLRLNVPILHLFFAFTTLGLDIVVYLYSAGIHAELLVCLALLPCMHICCFFSYLLKIEKRLNHLKSASTLSWAITSIVSPFTFRMIADTAQDHETATSEEQLETLLWGLQLCYIGVFGLALPMRDVKVSVALVAASSLSWTIAAGVQNNDDMLVRACKFAQLHVWAFFALMGALEKAGAPIPRYSSECAEQVDELAANSTCVGLSLQAATPSQLETFFLKACTTIFRIDKSYSILAVVQDKSGDFPSSISGQNFQDFLAVQNHSEFIAAASDILNGKSSPILSLQLLFSDSFRKVNLAFFHEILSADRANCVFYVGVFGFVSEQKTVSTSDACVQMDVVLRPPLTQQLFLSSEDSLGFSSSIEISDSALCHVDVQTTESCFAGLGQVQERKETKNQAAMTVVSWQKDGFLCRNCQLPPLPPRNKSMKTDMPPQQRRALTADVHQRTRTADLAIPTNRSGTQRSNTSTDQTIRTNAALFAEAIQSGDHVSLQGQWRVEEAGNMPLWVRQFYFDGVTLTFTPDVQMKIKKSTETSYMLDEHLVGFDGSNIIFYSRQRTKVVYSRMY